MTLSQPNQVGCLQNFQYSFLWISHDDLNKKTNRQTNKQTNTFLDQQYLSQKKSNLYETFRNLPVGIPRWFKQKQTNTQRNNFVNQQYLSQIKLIFMKHSGNLTVGIPRWFKQKQKIFCELTISQPKLSYIFTTLSVKLPELKWLGLLKATSQGA